MKKIILGIILSVASFLLMGVPFGLATPIYEAVKAKELLVCGLPAEQVAKALWGVVESAGILLYAASTCFAFAAISCHLEIKNRIKIEEEVKKAKERMK